MASTFFKSLFSRTIIPTKMGETFIYPVGMAADLFGNKNYLKDFLEIPELNAIINIKARAMASWILSIQSKATGLEQSANESLVRILRSPNWFQGQGEFWKQSAIYRAIYGNEYLYFLKPVGMSNTYKGMFTLDPSKVTIKYNSKNLHFTESTNEAVEYWYNTGDGKILLDKANLIHLNDNRVQSDNFLLGTSIIEPLQAPIHNIRESYKKRNISLKMPVGIISNGQSDALGQAVPMNQKEKDKAQLALSSHGAKPIMTNLSINYDAMNVNAANMGLFEEVTEDTGRICDALGVPFKLLSSLKGGTLNNSGGELRESRKQMYEDTIIPDANEKIDALNLYLGTDKKSWHIVADFKHLPVFAEDQKQRAISLKQIVEALSKALADGAINIEQYESELAKFGI